ncbi:MAG: hypothetical protein MRECE_2c071 [Mycoplasmataceae bacterium CE_OT135]|nr:MAG: hypothetical protein MRECE_2c071 [Mycoplasmataceae bacterium CE_OT135]
MKTWEKWYWGIVLGLFALVVVSILISKEGVKVVNTIGNKTTVSYVSKSKALAYFIPCWLGFFGLIWLIAKFATGGFNRN